MNQRGFSLPEMMVSVALLAIVVLAGTSILTSLTNSTASLTGQIKLGSDLDLLMSNLSLNLSKRSGVPTIAATPLNSCPGNLVCYPLLTVQMSSLTPGSQAVQTVKYQTQCVPAPASLASIAHNLCCPLGQVPNVVVTTTPDTLKPQTAFQQNYPIAGTGIGAALCFQPSPTLANPQNVVAVELGFYLGQNTRGPVLSFIKQQTIPVFANPTVQIISSSTLRK